MHNYQPICDKPMNGCMSNGAGYRLCVNPSHNDDPTYKTLGPVWHNMREWAEWPESRKTKRYGLSQIDPELAKYY